MSKLSLALLAVLLAGCSQVSEYRRPAAPVAEQFPAAGGGSRDIQQTTWRNFFPDPRLQALIAQALDHNRDLRIAVGRVEEARAQFGLVSAERLPTVNLNLSETAAGTPGGIYGVSQPISNRRADMTLSTVSYEIDFWGRVAALTASARASFLATEEARRALRTSLIAEIANAYFTLLEMEERKALVVSTVATREKSLALTQRARERGAAAAVEVLQAEGALESAKAELSAIERQRLSSINTLSFLVGRPLEEMPAGRTLAEQDVDSGFVTGLPSELLLRRPDVIGAEQRLIAAHANVDAARGAFFPRIMLSVGIGFASKALAGLFSTGSGAWSYQPAVTQPLFDGGRTEANFDAARARENIAVADYEKTIQQAFREVADLLSARESLVEQGRATEANLKTLKERLKIAAARYKAGSISYMEVLEAQREVWSMEQVAIQVRRLQLATAAQLYKALGGGDEPRPLPMAAAAD